MKAKIFWHNVGDLFERFGIPALALWLGAIIGMTQVLGQNKANSLADAIWLESFLGAFAYFELFLFLGFLFTLVKVIVDSLQDKHPIRNQEKDDYISTKSVVIYNTLPKKDQERIDALENLLYETYLAAHPANPKKKFFFKFGAKRND